MMNFVLKNDDFILKQGSPTRLVRRLRWQRLAQFSLSRSKTPKLSRNQQKKSSLRPILGLFWVKTTSLSIHCTWFGTTYSGEYVYIKKSHNLQLILGLNCGYIFTGAGTWPSRGWRATRRTATQRNGLWMRCCVYRKLGWARRVTCCR